MRMIDAATTHALDGTNLEYVGAYQDAATDSVNIRVKMRSHQFFYALCISGTVFYKNTAEAFEMLSYMLRDAVEMFRGRKPHVFSERWRMMRGRLIAPSALAFQALEVGQLVKVGGRDRYVTSRDYNDSTITVNETKWRLRWMRFLSFFGKRFLLEFEGLVPEESP
jgi:hypothetical protein